MDTPIIPPQGKKYSGIVIGAVLVILVILVGLVLTKTSILSGLRIPNFTASPTPKQFSDAWKIYTDTTFKFEFKYPSNATLSTADVAGMKSTVVIKNIARDPSTDVTLMIGDKWAATNTNANNPNTTISGMTASREDVSSDQNPPQTLLFFKNGTVYYTFQFTWDGKNQEALNLFNQILATFKFIDSQNQEHPVKNDYACPASGWVDCIPGPTVKSECSPAAMEWYKANCPDFKGGAL